MMIRNSAFHFLALLCTSIIGNVHAANLTNNDLMDCKVLTGEKKQPQYQKFVKELTQAAVKGDAKSGLNLAGILNNRFICLEEPYLGNESWTMVVESPDKHEVETKHRPTLKNLKQYPATYAALRDAITAYQRIAESSLAARGMLGNYYAHYNDTLAKQEDGYFYLASTYEAECGTPQASIRKNSRCTMLKQDKMLYLPLLSSTQRESLDQKAKDWAKQYLFKLN
jgi:hypothetical protein